MTPFNSEISSEMNSEINRDNKAANPQQAFYDRIARYYDGENVDFVDDLAMYSELTAEHADPILDLGCGSGRITLHLASEGRIITGIDFSRVMLDRGRKLLQGRADLRENVTFLQGDVLEYDYQEQYEQIICGYNFLMQFTSAERQRALIARCADLLVPNGVLFIDLPNAGENFAAENEHGVHLERTFIDPESGNVVMQQTVASIDRTAQLQNITWIYDEIGADGTLRRTFQPQLLRYVFPTELEYLLELYGLRMTGRYGDYDLSAFEEGCPRLIVRAVRSG